MDEILEHDSKKETRLDIVKKNIAIFVHTKRKMNLNHEFALGVLTEGAIWVNDFTNDVDSFLSKLIQLKTLGKFESFNMSSVFETV
jgi:hypothetical protein